MYQDAPSSRPRMEGLPSEVKSQVNISESCSIYTVTNFGPNPNSDWVPWTGCRKEAQHGLLMQ